MGGEVGWGGVGLSTMRVLSHGKHAVCSTYGHSHIPCARRCSKRIPLAFRGRIAHTSEHCVKVRNIGILGHCEGVVFG